MRHARPIARCLVAATAGLMLAWPVMTDAAEDARVADVRPGFAGVYRTGSWTPLEIEFRQAAAPHAVCAWVEDPDGQYVRSPVAAVVGSPPRAVVTVRFGRPVGRVLIEELAGEPSAVTPAAAIAADRSGLAVRMLPPPLPAAERIMLVLGDLPAAERASRLMARDDGTRPRVVTLGAAADSGQSAARDDAGVGAGGAAAPARTARDFDGVDVIIICGRAVAGFDPAMLRGIDEWVRLGGRLVFLAGESAVDVQRGATAAAGWLPGHVERIVPLRRAGAIEAYARASRPLDKNTLASLGIPLLRNARAIEGVVEAFEGRGPGDQPLVVRRALGLGTIAWIGADIDRPPFRTWSGSDSLLVELLGGRAGAKDDSRSGESQRGGVDLAGQLRQAIDQFPGVTPIPFEVIAGLGAIYVACLYPFDWWLSGRRGGRSGGRRLAWITLPLVVALSSGLAWAAGQRWKGDAWHTSAAELVDLDVAGGLVRANGYAGIWSPVNARLNVAAGTAARVLAVAPPADAARPGDAVTWFAPCGRGIGGTDAAAPHPSLATADYASGGPRGDASDGLVGVPIAASSSRLFEVECVGTLEAPPVESSLVKEGQGTLRGGLTSRLPFVLEDCSLAHAGWLYEIGRLEPGRGYDTATGRGPRSLSGALTRRTTNRDRDIAVRWNQAEGDPLRILEIAGFHAAAGGRAYTGLEPGRLGRLDLSPVLPLDRAVLVGRGPSFVAWRCAAAAFDADTTATVPPMPAAAAVWRIVIPLGRTATTGSPSPDTPAPDTPAPDTPAPDSTVDETP
jgi:hypothetical protein